MDSRPSTLLDLLTRRTSVLRELNNDPVRKRDLAARLDVSRSTVDRALRELATQDLVERTDDGYRTTLAGRLTLDAFDHLQERTRGIDAALDVLTVLPHDAPFPPDLFAGATVVRPSPIAPHRPAETNAQLLSWADNVNGLISAVSEQYVDNYRDAIDGGTSVQMVFPSAVLERLVSEYGTADDPVFHRDIVEVRQTSETLPCSVKLHERDGEQVASLTVYGPDGLRGLVTNDSPEAVSWTASFIDRHWDAADPLPSP
ncbi:helix-turn-helix transcriptional regulator [Halomarina salina]|uniref:Helix-turn-helix transcriptional regulator n=1 Tax=Halomarina salina TaxID=1872699 RepID=A0ABD5RSK5_9EURY|nr:MarR family transcriptional regulator [Halomarina salina]